MKCSFSLQLQFPCSVNIATDTEHDSHRALQYFFFKLQLQELIVFESDCKDFKNTGTLKIRNQGIRRCDLGFVVRCCNGTACLLKPEIPRKILKNYSRAPTPDSLKKTQKYNFRQSTAHHSTTGVTQKMQFLSFFSRSLGSGPGGVILSIFRGISGFCGFAIPQRKFLRVRGGCQASQRKGLTSGEVRGTSGNPWIAGKFHSERTSGEVAEKLPGKFGELLGKSRGFPEARGKLTPSQRHARFVSKSL